MATMRIRLRSQRRKAAGKGQKLCRKLKVATALERELSNGHDLPWKCNYHVHWFMMYLSFFLHFHILKHCTIRITNKDGKSEENNYLAFAQCFTVHITLSHTI